MTVRDHYKPLFASLIGTTVGRERVGPVPAQVQSATNPGTGPQTPCLLARMTSPAVGEIKESDRVDHQLETN
jgi:hypothetical protein